MKTITDYTRTPSAAFLYRLSAGCKFRVMFVFSIFLFFAGTLPVILISLIFITGIYRVGGLTFRYIWQQIRPLWWILIALLIFQFYYTDWQNALVTVGRLVSLLLLAGFIMLTTPISAIMAMFERGFRFLQPLGINPAKIALVLSLTLRFIPVLLCITQEVREAQKARGLERSMVAVAVPVIIRMLKMSEDIGAAMEARCYDDS